MKSNLSTSNNEPMLRPQEQTATASGLPAQEIRSVDNARGLGQDDSKSVHEAFSEWREAKVESKFSYYKLNKYFAEGRKDPLEEGSYYAIVPLENPNFIALSSKQKEGEKNTDGILLFTVGLKFHLSFPEPEVLHRKSRSVIFFKPVEKHKEKPENTKTSIGKKFGYGSEGGFAS